jgi:hypothetical protein
MVVKSGDNLSQGHLNGSPYCYCKRDGTLFLHAVLPLNVNCYIRFIECIIDWWRKVAAFGHKFLSTRLGKARI